MPTPEIAPTETCVVDTGTPRRVAPITMQAVTRLAVRACPSFIFEIFLLMVSATLRAWTSPPNAIAKAIAIMLTLMSSA